jgi:predicted RNase H-like nuclease (RuvC/YqgF family)
MSEEVVTQAPAESAIAPSTEATAPVEETPTQLEGEDVATYKKRLAGKDQALTATKKELDAIKKEAEDLKRWKAEIEERNLSEFEKAQLKIKSLEETLQREQEVARQERLAREYPLAYQFLKDTSNLDEVGRAAALENFVKQAAAAAAPESAPSPVDPNNARRATAAPTEKPNSKSISDALKALGNPFADR